MAAKTTGAAPAAPAENLASADPVAAALSEPLDPRRVSTRKGSGSQRLSYLQAHDVKRTANRIFGWGGWSYYVDELVLLGEEPFTRNGKNGIRVGYRATVTVLAGGVQRGDSGYGDAMEYGGSRITPHELASKEAVSDALKRCLASFGDQFGLCLYGDDPAPPEEPRDEIPDGPQVVAKGTSKSAPRPLVSPDHKDVQRVRELAAQVGYNEKQIQQVLDGHRKQAKTGELFEMPWLVDTIADLTGQIEARAAKKSAEGES